MFRGMLKKRVGLDRCRNNSVFFRGKNIGRKGQVRDMCLLKKRGQITIFIILGILLLLALILVVLLKKEAIVFKPEEIIPTEKGRIENYITICIDEIGDEALFLIGLQGGYTEIPEDILVDSSQHLKLSPYDVVPYWARGESIRIPSLDEIKRMVDDKIELELRDCLLGKEVFTEAYDIVEKSEVEANTEIVDKKVIFNVRWNLEIKDKAGEMISEVIDHAAESPIKLKRAYETARAIVETEMNELKFEYLTVDLLSLEHPKVPITGVEVGCGKKKWKVNEAKEKLKDMLRINLRELKVEGTSFVEFPDSLPYYQNHYVWDVGVEYSEMGVNFNYNNNFPFYFEVTPRDGNTMKSGMTEGSDMLSYVCVQMWKFTYDVMYPVSVEIIDETTGYVFHTAFTVHVKRNRADRSGEVLTPSGMDIDFPESEEYCKKREIPVTVFTYELIENNETGAYWTDALDEVSLSYTCLKYRCEIGETEYNFGGIGPGVAAYRTNFPYCTGGILRGVKEGYKENWVRVVANKEQEVELNLIPLFEFPGKKIKVDKHGFTSMVGIVEGEISEGSLLGEGETVSIKIKRNKEEWGPHEAKVVLSPDLDEAVLEESYLEFLGETDYEYEVEIYLMDDEGIKGGYEGNWTVSWEELKLGNEITFHVLSKDKFKDETEFFDFMTNLEEYSSINAEVLSPKIR